MIRLSNRQLTINCIVIVLMFFMFVSSGIAAPEKKQVEVRRFDKQIIEQYQSDDAFFYLVETKSKTDYKALLYSWVNNMLTKIFGSRASIFLLQNIHYLLILLAVSLILYKVTNVSFASSSFRINSKKYADHFDEIEHVEKVDFESLIQEALKNSNYRLAIRYQYLNMLKKLSVSGFIEHSPHKTNVEYTYELKDNRLRDSFRQIAFIFDYVWYGENRLNNNTYSELQPSFSGFEDVLMNASLSRKE